MQTIINYSDGGHSWFKVSRDELYKYDLLDKISHFSYQYGNNVYLEEDCDAAIYFKAVLGKDNITYNDIQARFNIKNQHTNRSSKIRNYVRFTK